VPLLTGSGRYFFWDSIFWVQSPFGTIFNPGVASSFALVWIGLWALVRWQRRRAWGELVFLALVWGVLPGFKVYAGLLMLGGLLAAGAVRWLLDRDWTLLAAAGAVLPVFALVFWPANAGAHGLVHWLPGFNLATMLVAPDRLGLMSSAALKHLYTAHRPLTVLLLGLLVPVFVVGNLGVRSLALAPLLQAMFRPRGADPILLFIAAVGCGALAGSLGFVQSGMQWNTVQFFYYAVLLAALPAAHQFWEWAGAWGPRQRWAAVAVFTALGLPNTFQAWAQANWGYRVDAETVAAYRWVQAESRPSDRLLRPLPEPLQTEAGYAQWLHQQERGSMTSLATWSQEASALDAAAATTTAAAGATSTDQASPVLPPGATLTAQALPAAAEETVPPASPERITPLGWQDTASVAALTGRNTYLEDTISALIMGQPVAERVRTVNDFYTRAGVVEARTFLEENRITYVVTLPGQKLPFDPAGVPLRRVFANRARVVYKYLSPQGW
jgi:hypothetical protein